MSSSYRVETYYQGRLTWSGCYTDLVEARVQVDEITGSGSMTTFRVYEDEKLVDIVRFDSLEIWKSENLVLRWSRPHAHYTYEDAMREFPELTDETLSEEEKEAFKKFMDNFAN